MPIEQSVGQPVNGPSNKNSIQKVSSKARKWFQGLSKRQEDRGIENQLVETPDGSPVIQKVNLQVSDLFPHN